jgi:hypothetical protein
LQHICKEFVQHTALLADALPMLPTSSLLRLLLLLLLPPLARC